MCIRDRLRTSAVWNGALLGSGICQGPASNEAPLQIVQQRKKNVFCSRSYTWKLVHMSTTADRIQQKGIVIGSTSSDAPLVKRCVTTDQNGAFYAQWWSYVTFVLSTLALKRTRSTLRSLYRVVVSLPGSYSQNTCHQTMNNCPEHGIVLQCIFNICELCTTHRLECACILNNKSFNNRVEHWQDL